jgi:hypothetical protein
MSASKKLMTWMLVATVFGTTAAACGSDDDSTSDAKAATTVAADTPADTAGGDVASGNPEVTAFCEAADKVAEEFKKVMADPASGDVAALTASATELTTKATALSASSPADANAISACLQNMSTAMTGG